MPKTVGIILAGGLARRMGGGDKSLSSLGSQTILDHVIRRISPQVDMLALNANGDPERLKTYGLPVLADSIQGYVGPLAGVLAGMDWAAENGAELVISVAADTPFFPLDLVKTLQHTRQNSQMPITIAASRGENGKLFRQPVFGAWPVSLRDDLRRALQDGMRKIIVWAEQHGVDLVEFPVDQGAKTDPFFNINTPGDLQEAQQLLRK